MLERSAWTSYGKLVGLFFLTGMGLGMWFVPLSTVLDAHGLGSIKPYAFATSAVASFISPLIFGAIADRHWGPVRVLRWLGVCTGTAMAVASTGIALQWNPWTILGLIQVHALFSAPAWSIATTIVLAGLQQPKQEFGPVRAMATLGWMAGCGLVSALNADNSALAGYSGAIAWFCVSAYTLRLPSVTPPAGGQLTLRERLGLDALSLLRIRDHRVVFLTAALFSIPLAAFYPYTPPHLRDLGLSHTSAWMSLGQITEVIAMFGLARLFASWRLKWIFALGLGFGVIRYIFCSFNVKGMVLFGVLLHGFSFTLFYVTAQIYLDERIDPAWRARAQALMALMTSGVGNLLGYLSTGWWLRAVRLADGSTRWSLFWGVLSSAVAVVALVFLIAYRGKRSVKSSPH